MIEIIEIGQKIEMLRKQLNLNQADLATLSGVGIKTIRNIEQGKDGTSISNLIKVASIVGATLKISIKKMSDENTNNTILYAKRGSL